MTLFKPSLLLERLIIVRGKHALYDEVFHEGVNIIRGSNGGGKTTIVESIIYVLGGDIKTKKDEFKLCDYVYAQFKINGETLTFKRAIEEEGFPPISICEASFEKCYNEPDVWTRYPNRRTSQQKSYSEIIFSLLGFPEEKVENEQNVTVHDILRLLYEDQNTTSDKIFLSQNYPEKNIKRQAVSDLLLGIDDLELHRLRRQLNEKEKDWSVYEGQIKQIHRVLGSSELNDSLSMLLAKKVNIEAEQKDIRDKISSLYEKQDGRAANSAQTKFDKMKAEIVSLKNNISERQNEQASLDFEINDSMEFITSLEVRIDALTASTEVTKALGAIDFSYCPSCLQVVEPDDSEHQCGLCKKEIKEENLAVGYLKMRNEIAFQLKESKRIVKRREDKREKVTLELDELRRRLKELQRQHKSYVYAVSPVEAEIRTLIERTGFLERALQDIEEKEVFARKVALIMEKKAELSKEISKLEDAISAAERSRENNREKLYTAINDNTISLIKNDPRNELEKVERISFDFGKDEMFAVGKASPAASTGSYLKNSFFFSIFQASLEYKSARYPRFIIMDNIEDKGMQTDRIHQFHNDIIEISNGSNVKHQILLTVRSEMMQEKLVELGLCVGREYDDKKDIYSLDFNTPKEL